MQCEADADLSVGAVAHVYKESVEYSKIKARKIDLLEPSSEAKEAFYDLNQKFLLYGPCNKLYKTEIIAKNQIMFPEDTSYGEDLLFNFSYLKCCRSIVCGSQPCYFYNHENENSLSHRYQENLFENGLRLTETIYSFRKKNSCFRGKCSISVQDVLWMMHITVCLIYGMISAGYQRFENISG